MPKTPISYYGGKINMIPTILPLIPPHKIYTEAFFGGGAIFFAKEKSKAETINDINNMVVNFYEVVQTDFDKLKSKVEATLFSRVAYNVAMSIYKMPHLFSKLQQAWAFYIATNMGFSCQIGSWGYDKYNKRVKSFWNRKLIFDESIAKRLKGVQIENNDACKVIANRNTVDAFHYVDPPYFNSNMGHYSGYTKEDYTRLLETLSRVQGKFLLSSYPSEILDQYIKKNGWYTKTVTKIISASKAVAGVRRKVKTEVLTANYPI
ncbi:MAG: DNA adenine methylase [Flavobacteriaceae bacterium]|nr:DNA adenine methylase [Flavobacteriaceae bacterium]